ncbi:hypothetical protein LSTR_LSTR011618 [Laodelphax striatellus]|uniref:C2H2-type domain-containing protein n=1 Tax=Laodelphax striatellus TaxID=195883 RepID=A0A482X7I8_LAOST|nr:hypothetical protein LSTR_LSTR011618 [Laodelphax striatellus]
MLRKMNRSMMITDGLQSDFDKRPLDQVTLGSTTHKNYSSTSRPTIHVEKELYPLRSLTSKSPSSTDLSGDNLKEYSDDVNLSKKKSTSTNIDGAPVSLAVESESNKTNQLNKEILFSVQCLDSDNKSTSNNIESTLIQSRNVDNCISNDYNYCNFDDNSMSIASEGNDNAECDTDIGSYDLTLQTNSSLMNTSTSLCEVVDNSGVNSSSIANGTEDNINACCDSSLKKKDLNDRNSTEVSLLSATWSSEIAKSFQGHYYRMETDINSDLLCHRVPYLVVESRMGTKHMIYTVFSNLSKFDTEHNYMLNTDSVYLTVQTFDLENPNTTSMLIEWVNNVLKGKISLMPYYFSWLDEKNQLNLGFKCIICKRIIRDGFTPRQRETVMDHIADHLLFSCPVCSRFHRNITNMKNHLYQHETVTFECTKCSKKFSDFEKYIMHKRGHYKFECLSCRFECSVEKKWLKHLEEHRKKICSSDCCLFYESIEKFQKHVSVLSNVGGYVCGACGMAYHCEEYLKLHLRVHGLEHGSMTTTEASLPESSGSQNEATRTVIDRLKNFNENIHFDTSTLKNILDNEIDIKQFQSSSTALGGGVFTGFMCFKCSRVLTTEKKFRIHIGNHFMMTCHCKRFMTSIKTLRNHFKLCRFKRRICVHCRNDVWLDTSTEYIEHPSLHQKRRICIYCQQVLPTPQKLERHINSSHNTEETKHWFCKDCNETLLVSYKSLEGFKFNHFKERHPNKLRIFVCETCGKHFNRKSGLLQHTKQHSANDFFICAYCNKKFSIKNSLLVHIRQHMNEKTFKCTICDKAFNRESSLHKHNLDMHSVKKHMCNVCEKRFSYPSALRDHMRKAHPYVKSAIYNGMANH